MNRRVFCAVVSGAILFACGNACAADVNCTSVRRSVQEFVDKQIVAGAVACVGRPDGTVCLEAVGFQDIAVKTPMRTDSLFRIASMTKPVTAIGIMILEDEGKLRVEDPVEKYLPEFKGQMLRSGKEKDAPPKRPSRPITILDLATHTSGMKGGLPVEPKDLYLKRDCTLAEAVPLFAKLPLETEPGTKWAYCNMGIDTLGRIIEVVSGQKYEDFLKRRVFDPLGMADTCFYPGPKQAPRIAVTYRVEKDSLTLVASDIIGPPAGAKYPIPAGGLYSTAPDLARLYQMMLHGGQLNGKRIISAESAAKMTRIHTPEEVTPGFVPGMAFGIGFGVVRRPEGVTAMLSPGTFGHGGAFGTQGWIDPTQKAFFILLIQRVGMPNGDGSEIRTAFQTAAVAALKAGK